MGKDDKRQNKPGKGGSGNSKSGLKGKGGGAKLDKNSKVKGLLKNSFSSSRERHTRNVDALKRNKSVRAFDTSIYAKGRCLVVGDGDLTFSVALCKNLCNRTMLASTYDSKDQVLEKYPSTKQSLTFLKERNVPVLHGIDATDLSKHFPNALRAKYSKNKMLQLLDKGVTEEELASGFRNYPFDTIIFNFPHSGAQRVHINQELLRKFFISCRPHLCADEERPGKVIVTLKKGSPYDGWHIEEQAALGLFQLDRKFPFDFKVFPGYGHVTTNPEHNVVEEDGCFVYVFKLSAVGRLVAKEENVILKKDTKQLVVPVKKEKVVATVDRTVGLDDVKNRLGSFTEKQEKRNEFSVMKSDENDTNQYKIMFADFNMDMLADFEEKKPEGSKKKEKKEKKTKVVEEEAVVEEIKPKKEKKEKNAKVVEEVETEAETKKTKKQKK